MCKYRYITLEKDKEKNSSYSVYIKQYVQTLECVHKDCGLGSCSGKLLIQDIVTSNAAAWLSSATQIF